MLIAMFLCLGAFFIISNNNLHLEDAKELHVFGGQYMHWLGNLFSNTKSISGYLVKFEWLPGNNSTAG